MNEGVAVVPQGGRRFLCLKKRHQVIETEELGRRGQTETLRLSRRKHLDHLLFSSKALTSGRCNVSVFFRGRSGDRKAHLGGKLRGYDVEGWSGRKKQAELGRLSQEHAFRSAKAGESELSVNKDGFKANKPAALGAKTGPVFT